MTFHQEHYQAKMFDNKNNVIIVSVSVPSPTKDLSLEEKVLY